MKTRSIVYIAVMAALICALAPLSIPTGWGVAYSLGTLAVYIVCGLIDWKHGMASIGVYLMLGVCCLPVFAGYRNLYACISGPTFGYVVGYIPCAFFAGIMIDRVHKFKALWYPVALIIGTAMLYLTGTLWFCFVAEVNFITALMLCVVPYLAGDAAKIAIATALIIILKPKLSKYKSKLKSKKETASE